MLEIDNNYAEFLNYFNEKINSFINEYVKDCPKILGDSIKYAVVDGGKRVRPVLCLATAKMLGLSFDEVINYALAIEFIHSYSLVHDDLPSMDNDDYRRGKLSTHKMFGEAYGVLAGDALLNLSIEACLSKRNMTSSDILASKLIFELAGAKGMIAGQVLDLQNEKNNNINSAVLYDIYFNKTAKLIIAPVLVASIVANKKYFDELYKFAANLGLLFQITDDIIDVEGSFEIIGKTPNKDGNCDKFTSVKLYGLVGAKNRASELYLDCKNILSKIPNSDFLQSFTEKMYFRNK